MFDVAVMRSPLVSSSNVVLADPADQSGLRSLLAQGFGEAHLLAELQVLELCTSDAIAMKINLTAVGGGDEAVVPLGMQRGDRSMRRRLVLLDLALADASKILELPTGSLERVADRHMHVSCAALAAGSRLIAMSVPPGTANWIRTW